MIRKIKWQDMVELNLIERINNEILNPLGISIADIPNGTLNVIQNQPFERCEAQAVKPVLSFDETQERLAFMGVWDSPLKSVDSSPGVWHERVVAIPPPHFTGKTQFGYREDSLTNQLTRDMYDKMSSRLDAPQRANDPVPLYHFHMTQMGGGISNLALLRKAFRECTHFDSKGYLIISPNGVERFHCGMWSPAHTHGSLTSREEYLADRELNLSTTDQAKLKSMQNLVDKSLDKLSCSNANLSSTVDLLTKDRGNKP